jgi:acetolactate synthase-1/2/3 large subunit
MAEVEAHHIERVRPEQAAEQAERRRAAASQALDQAALLATVTKWVGRVETADSLEPVLAQALRVATGGRAPVVLEIPEDAFAAEAVDPPSGQLVRLIPK